MIGKLIPRLSPLCRIKPPPQTPIFGVLLAHHAALHGTAAEELIAISTTTPRPLLAELKTRCALSAMYARTAAR